MIAAEELMSMKQRMLIAADAAYRIASTSEQFVMHDQEQYELVIGSLVALKSDVRRLMAEHDILRGMFSEKLSSFLTEGFANERPAAVCGVPTGESVSRCETPRPDEAAVDEPVREERPARKRAKRSNARRNRKGDGEVQGELGSGNGAVAVDGSKDA